MFSLYSLCLYISITEKISIELLKSTHENKYCHLAALQKTFRHSISVIFNQDDALKPSKKLDFGFDRERDRFEFRDVDLVI